MSTSTEPTEQSKPQDQPKRDRVDIDQWYRAVQDPDEGPRPIFDEFVRPARRTPGPQGKAPPGDATR